MNQFFLKILFIFAASSLSSVAAPFEDNMAQHMQPGTGCHGAPMMPNDTEIVPVLSYLRNNRGNQAAPVTESDVSRLRERQSSR